VRVLTKICGGVGCRALCRRGFWGRKALVGRARPKWLKKAVGARFLLLAAAAGARHRCSSAEPTAPCRGPRLQLAESGHGRLWNGNNLGVTRGPPRPLKRPAAGPEASAASAEPRQGGAGAAEGPAAVSRSAPTWEQQRGQDGRGGSVSRRGEYRVGAGLTCIFFGWRGAF